MRWLLLEGLAEEEVQRLLGAARRRRWERGEVVFHRDDPADTLHLVSAGRFAVTITTPRGDTAVLNVLGPGDIFGEVGLAPGIARRSATVVALEPARTLTLHQLDFERLCKEHPGVTDVLIAVLARQVVRLSDWLVEALFMPAERRLLRRVVEVGALYEEGSSELSIPLTQERLAQLAGTSRATVNRVLGEQERRGTVRLERGRVVVLDRAALASKAGLGDPLAE